MVELYGNLDGYLNKTTAQPRQDETTLYEKKSANACCACRNRR
jgi:hypothetical protein